MGATWRRGSAGALLAGGILGLTVLSPGGAVQSAQTPGALPLSGCVARYTVPPGGASSTELSALAFPAPDDGWAIGTSTTPAQISLYAMHWNGQTWTPVPMPNSGGPVRAFTALAALSSRDVWAVGSADDSNIALTLHWDGAQWQQIPVVAAGGQGGLTGVAAVASDDVWAVGHTYGALLKYQEPLILHWDGHRWATAAIPRIPGSPSTLAAVSARAADDVWAAGRAVEMMGGALHFLHWNGASWSDIAVADAGPDANIEAIQAIAADDVWATGGDRDGPLIMHWDGHVWRRVATPPGGAYQSTLSAIAAVSASDVWAAGTSNVVRSSLDSGSKQLLVMHWDGQAWSRVSTSDPGSGAVARAAAATRAGRLWLAGSYPGPAGATTGFVQASSAGPCASPAPGGPPGRPLGPPVAVPGSGSRTFPETGKTVSGLFLAYWLGHGGLAQQGYPISDVLGEVSDLDGKLYTIQYFERAVFEYHPENAPSNNVLLSHLGTFAYRQKYPNGAPGQTANTSAGSLLFPQTGRRLGGAFQVYWNRQGGLPQQGYPLSDPFTELSDLNGRPYLVQYFERAVFEWHPENQPPYDVLLSQLGRFRYARKYGGPPAATPGPRPSPTAPSARWIADVDGRPVVAGHDIFWLSGHADGVAVNGYDLAQNRPFVLAASATNKGQPVSDGKIVVWLQDCPPYCQRIRGYDLRSNTEFHIIEPAPGRAFFNLFLDGGTLYYQKYTGTALDLYAYDLASGTETAIPRSRYGNDIMFRGVIESGLLLWAQADETQHDWSLYFSTLDGSQTAVLVAQQTEPFTGYHASGENIVWSTYPTPRDTYQPVPADPRAYIYNIRTGQRRPISSGLAHAPVIQGDIAAWTRQIWPDQAGSGPHGPVEAYDLTSGTGWTVVPDGGVDMWVEGLVDQKQLVFSAEDPGRGTRGVFVSDLLAPSAGP